MTPALNDQQLLVDRSDADEQEKQLIIQSLSTLIEHRTVLAATAAVGNVVVSTTSTAPAPELRDLFIPRVAGSTFDEVCDPPRMALQKMLKSDAFAALRSSYAYPADAPVYVDQDANVFVLIDSEPPTLSMRIEQTATIAAELAMLAEYAALTGGSIYSGEQISVEQWLRHEEFILPKTVSDVKNLIAYLRFKLPDSPALGDYRELIDADKDSPFHLSDRARDVIKTITLEITQGKTSLLQKLALNNFNAISASHKREHAETFINRLLQNKTAKALGRAIHERLAWHLDLDNVQVSDQQLMQMAAAALIIDMKVRTDQHVIAGYDVYQPDNAPLGAAQVREALERHLIANTLIEENVAPLAAHLLLASAAPELLVREAPDELTLDKPGWVVIAQTVAALEYAALGASRAMTYSQIKAFSDLAPVTLEQHRLDALTGIIPVVNWAALNGVIAYRIEKNYDSTALIEATTQFNRYMDALGQSEKGLATTPPDRRKIALEALKKVLPAGNYLEQKSFHYTYQQSATERSWLEALSIGTPSGIFAESYDYLASAFGVSEFALSPLLRLRLSVLDLYISGDLIQDGQLTQRFKTKDNFNPPAGAFARLAELESPDELFEAAFDAYYNDVWNGMASVIKMAISSLPEVDRYTLTNCKMTLYTVRKGVNPLNPNQETQFHRDEAKGRYGLILCCQNSSETRCFEIFTLRGLCRERPELAILLKSTGIIHDTPSLSYVGGKHDFQPKNPEKAWPLDFAAYKEGSEPRGGITSQVVVEKLWYLNLTTNDIRPVALFFSSQLQSLAELILTHHPVATRQELYDSINTLTTLQRWRAVNDASETALLNLIVPFKKCIEDIRSGEAPRVTEGIGGCVLDGLTVIGLLVGLGASAASIIAKTGSTAAKAWSIARAVARAALSLVNPIDGLPTLAFKGLKRAGRGVLWLTDQGVGAVTTATGQLRKLHLGTQSHDLLKIAQLSDVKHGTWRGADGLGDAIDLAVIQRQNSWHALNTKVGGAWGPSLRNLKAADLSPFKRFFRKPAPLSYTQKYVTKALPHAKSKLDNAISHLTNIGDDGQIHSVLKHLFGTSSKEAVQHINNNLRAMRSDLDSMSFANISFRQHGDKANAALKPGAYKRWKANGTPKGQPPERFLVIYADNLDDFYKTAKYEDARIGDVLVHEMAHGAPDTLDLYYGAVKTGEIPAEFDAVGLLEFARNPRKAHPKNLANPHFPFSLPEGFEEFESITRPTLIKDHPALLNAESYAVAVSLLDQYSNAPATFSFNLSAIENSLSSTAATDFIKGPLLLNLAKPNF